MKQIHLRLDDNDYDKLVKEATFYKVSLNKLITNKVLNEDTSPMREAPTQALSPKVSTTEIHRDLTNILIELNNIKTIIFDMIHTNNQPNNLSISEQNLARAITETKQEILKQLLIIQKKLKKL